MRVRSERATTVHGCIARWTVVRKSRQETTEQNRPEKPVPDRLTVSLKTLGQLLDAHRSSVRRWLRDAGIHPVVFGRGRTGAIRYRWDEVKQWVESLKRVE